jgi:hypothetical protein
MRGAAGGGMGGAPAGPSLGGDMAKIFGDNSAFTANLEVHTPGVAGGAETVMSGKIAYLEGKTRFEMDMAEMMGANSSPQAAAQMKQMGVDKMVSISRPDKKTTLVIYPGLQAYMETPIQDTNAVKPASDFKSQTTELGKETVDGHACVKNKVVVTDSAGKTYESTVWNATDLKNFPVKIESSEGGHTTTMLFKEVKFDKPAAGQFEAPADYKKYDDMMTMMQQEMMKRMGGGRGMTPGQP